MDNLYDKEIIFRIYDENNVPLEILEPIGWDNIALHIERDADYYGFVANYLSSEEVIKFGNDDEACFSLLETLYQNYRGDALAFFEVSYINSSGNEEVMFKLKLNFNYYENDGVYISLQVEEVDFTALLRTRYESEISMEDTENIDGLPVPSFTKKEISLHSREIYRKLFIETQSPRETGLATPRYAYMTLDSVETSDQSSSDLTGNQSVSISMRVNSFVPDNPFFVCPEDGTYNIRFQIRFRMTSTVIPDPFQAGPHYLRGYSVQPRLAIVRNGELILDNRYDKVERNPTTNIGGETVNFDSGVQIVTGLQLLTGDRIFIEYMMDSIPFSNANGTDFTVNEYYNECYIEAGTTAPSTTSIGYRMVDVLKKIISWYTGINADLLESSFLNNGGCGYHYHILNGFQIRNFTEDRPIKTSLKDYIESICAIFALGYSVVERGNSYKFLVETVDFFFQKGEDSLILSISDITSYREYHANDLIYNECEFGYEKFPTEGERALDEFNTVQKYLLPIKYYKNTFSKISKYIAAGYTIEEQRRRQFNTTELDSAPNDDDIFIIKTIDESDTKSIAQRNGGFVRIDGIYSPNTVYNLRISPKRIMLNWTNMLSTILVTKPVTDQIKNTEAKNNNKATSKIFADDLPFDACDRFERPFYSIQEGGDMVVGDFQQPLFDCMACDIECYLTFDEAIRIRKCLLATSANESANFGFIEFPTPQGQTVRGFVKTFEYSLVSNLAKISCYKIID